MTVKSRDVDADHLKAVLSTIAEQERAGWPPSEHLLERKRGLEAKIAARNPAVEPEPESKPEPEQSKPEPEQPEVEHKAADPAPETATPRRPGRPRKVSDGAGAAGTE